MTRKTAKKKASKKTPRRKKVTAKKGDANAMSDNAGQDGAPDNMAEFVLIPAAVLQQLVTQLGQIALQLGGLTTAIQGTARPLGQKKPE
jgi:hypothetical protein